MTKGKFVGLGILSGLTAIFEVIAIVMFIKVDMFPAVLIALVCVVMALILMLICTLFFATKKKRFGKARVVAIILSIITIISCGIGIFFMSELLGIFGTVLVGEDISKEKVQDPFIVYISGSDTRDNELSGATRSDVNIIAVVNPQTCQVLLLNTPRDYYIDNPALGYKKDKLTHCGSSGIENSMAALANLYDLSGIDYYCRINFTGFETLIDAIGGIDVYSDYAFTTEATSAVHIVQGTNHLNGEEALAFARERYALKDGDIGRGEHQMAVIKAIVAKVTSSDTLIKNYSNIMKSLTGMFETDVPQRLITSAVKTQLSDSPDWNIQSFTVTGSTGSAVCASDPGEQLSVVYQDPETISQAKVLINQVLNGEVIALP